MFQQLAGMLKLCAQGLLFWPWPFLDLDLFLTILQGHHNWLNCLTLTLDHGFNSWQWWCSCAQDLLLWPWPFFDTLKACKQLRFFGLFIMDYAARLNAGGFDSIGVKVSYCLTNYILVCNKVSFTGNSHGM